MSKILKNHYTSGFTLIEMLVAISLFAAVVAISAGAYLAIMKAQLKSINMKRVQEDSRYASEIIGREFRMGEVDYTYYGEEVPSPTSTLVLINSRGTEIKFRLESERLEKKVGDGSFIPLTQENIKVTDLKFYISPLTDPFVEGGPNIQPRVTICLTARSGSPGVPERETEIILQTTISSHMYKMR